MPYASNSELPSAVRARYREECQTAFRRAHDAALREYRDEGRAMAVAHTAAQRCEEGTGKAMMDRKHAAKMKAMASRLRSMADEMDAMDAEYEEMGEGKAELSAAAMNDLPDSAFACIDDGGKRDETGRTTPRSLRHYPHHTADGALDLPHLRNALARVAQEGTAACGKAHLEAHAKTAGIGDR